MPVSPEIGRVEDSCAQAPPSAPRTRRRLLITPHAVVFTTTTYATTSPRIATTGLAVLIAIVLWTRLGSGLITFVCTVVALDLGDRVDARDRGRA